jgi:S-DNA-T family DNA segregation ATPase FtsK/SpoIIIE
MFSKRNGNTRRRAAPAAPELSPRMARLLRESWWLLVAATFLYLALTLVTYTKSDPGWSFSGTGAPIGNRGGVIGAWLSDLLLYLFGLSAWWWVIGGVVLVVLGYRRVMHPDRQHEHPVALAAVGFVLALLSSAALEAIRLWRLPVSLPLAPGGALGDAIGQALARAVGRVEASLIVSA